MKHVGRDAKESWGNSAWMVATAVKAFGFDETDEHPGKFNKPVYRSIAAGSADPPFAFDEHALTTILDVVVDRKLRVPSGPRHPYWNPAAPYRLGAIFGAIMEHTDHHNAPVGPNGLFPPERDVWQYVTDVRRHPGRTPLDRQLEIALGITDDDLIGALQLCYVACRVIARSADHRVYGTIKADPPLMRKWANTLTQFPTVDPELNDIPGDTYHFWLQVFAQAIFDGQGPGAQFSTFWVENGLRVAWVLRSRTTESGEVARHDYAFKLGRAVGRTLCDSDYLDAYVSDRKATELARHISNEPFTRESLADSRSVLMASVDTAIAR